MSERFHFFWDGPFSQWHKSKFYIGTHWYNCAEQWMMASKALFFEDEETYHKIMDSDSPSYQKKLGRKVKGFDVDKWAAVAKDVVFKGNMAKFSQDPELKSILLETAPHTLVEASPYDTIWGIGLDADDPLALNRFTWKGLNWLGEVLVDVREYIKIKDKYKL